MFQESEQVFYSQVFIIYVAEDTECRTCLSTEQKLLSPAELVDIRFQEGCARNRLDYSSSFLCMPCVPVTQHL